MYLLKILVIQAIQLLVRSAIELPVSTDNNDALKRKNVEYEKDLIHTVEIYYNHIHHDDLFSIDPAMPKHYKCGELIDREIVQKLENNIYIILVRMLNHYNEQLKNINVHKIIDLFKTEYVDKICSYIPRGLDFIYICVPMYTNFKKILSLHSDLCGSRKTFLTEDRSSIENKRINLFYEPFSEEIPISTKHFTAEDDVSFVKKIFEIANKINKTDMVTGGDWESKFILQDYFDLSDLKIILPKSLLLDYNNKNTNIQTLNQKLKNIIFEHGQMFLKTININEIANYDENIMNHYNLVRLLNDLLLKVLHVLEFHFRKSVLDGPQIYIENEHQSDIIDYDTMKNILSIDMVQGICKHVPLILYYLGSNDVIKNNLFNSYLTLCSDWIYFLTVRCEWGKNENGKMLYDLQCVKQSVEDKILLNYFMILTENDNKIFNEVIPDKQSLKSIILKIHTELEKFYLDEDIYVWPTFDWLSAVHIFTDSFSFDYMNDFIKQQMVTLESENLSILEMYNQILPWNLNIKTILGFHTLIERSVIDNVLMFVWHQAKIIEFYFEHTNVNYFNDEVFKRLKISTQWYRTTILGLRKIMNITDGKFIVPVVILDIIEAIENIGKETVNGISNALECISDLEKNWNDSVISGNNRSDFLNNLNRIFLLNCYEAVDYINKYILIINKSKLKNIIINAYNAKEVCENQNLDDVFVANESFIRKYSESDYRVNETQEKLKRLKINDEPLIT